jgi:hypothetical protein
MANEMSAKDAAERMPQIMAWIGINANKRHRLDLSEKDVETLNFATEIVQAYADGRLVEVVHAHWAVVNTRKVCIKVACSWCGKAGWNFQHLPRCPYCGALMDERNDNNA